MGLFKRPDRLAAALCAAGTCLMFVGCEASSASEAQSRPQCVEIPDGEYAFYDGLFRPVVEPVKPMPSTSAQDQAKIDLEKVFGQLGYEWMTLQMRDDVALLSGFAPSHDNKKRGFAAGVALIRTDDVLNRTVRVIVDGITVPDGAGGEAEVTVDPVESYEFVACQSDLSDIFIGSSVTFSAEGIRLNRESRALLDDAAMVALRCADLDIDISGRAQTSASAEFDTVLSAARAEAVRRYLEDQGIASERMSVISYGETAPPADDVAVLTSTSQHSVSLRFAKR